jgi:GxxExxY protein
MPRRTPDHLPHSECTGKIIGAFYCVYKELGPGLAERVYSRALGQELDRRGCRVQNPSTGLISVTATLAWRGFGPT